jgi:hypothetical protein
MYKTITHNIVEEHYGQDQGERLKYVNPQTGLTDYLPQFVMNENTMTFRMDSRSIWAKYAWGLLNYGISMNAGLPVMEQVEARVFKNARALGDFITPYYGITAGLRFGDLLSSIGQVGIDVVKATKEKESLDKYKVMWADHIATLAEFLNELNPNNWPEVTTTEYLTNMVSFWVDEIQARAANNQSADEAAIESLNKLIVMGIPNSVPSHKASSLSDLFSRGIIAQYPALFAA